MVNGAGLAMATMDIIKLAGGEPANFLDVGGGANAEQIRNAFKILMSDKNVEAVLINIFGGILRCDVLAQGVIAAVKELGVPVPIVIRMEGTNVEEGKRMLKESGLNFTTADSMGEAADKVVALAGRRKANRKAPSRKAQIRNRESFEPQISKSQSGRPTRQEHEADRPGAHRTRGHVPREAGRGVRHHGRRRRHAGQRRHDARGLAGLQQRARRDAGDRRQRHRHLRAAAVCGRRDHGSGRRGYPAGRLHHRRHSRRSTC